MLIANSIHIKLDNWLRKLTRGLLQSQVLKRCCYLMKWLWARIPYYLQHFRLAKIKGEYLLWQQSDGDIEEAVNENNRKRWEKRKEK